MIKEKKNLEAEHKKRSSDGLSKTKSKVTSSHITSDLDIAPHTNHITSSQNLGISNHIRFGKKT